ncbi:hypothetical protein L345_03978, partial [Ophiophagus hannah]
MKNGQELPVQEWDQLKKLAQKKPKPLCITTLNIETLTACNHELAKILKHHHINIACLQETRWDRNRETLKNVTRLDEDTKDQFWNELQIKICACPEKDLLVLCGDLNGHVGRNQDGYQCHWETKVMETTMKIDFKSWTLPHNTNYLLQI